MTVFFIVAALFVLAAVLFIVPPLLKKEAGAQAATNRRELNISVYRDQMKELDRDLASDTITREQYEQSSEELKLRMLDDVDGAEQPATLNNKDFGRSAVIAAVLITAIIPMAAAGLYMKFGTPQAMDQQAAANTQTVVGADGEPVHDQIAQMIASLEQHLAENPQDEEGWTMLGRSYLFLERLDLAKPALEKALALNDRNPQVLVDYADVLAMNNDSSLDGRPMELIERALQIDPNNQKGLWLAGTAAYERGDLPQALEYWQRLLRLATPGSEMATAMQNSIAEVKAMMAGADPDSLPSAGQSASGGAPSTVKQVAASGARVHGTVDIDAALRARIDPNATLFVFARAASGPRMPLAVLRVPAKNLPMDFELDDSMAMDPALSLSKFAEVVVVARISSSGSAMTQSGDLQGSSGTVRPGEAGAIAIIINEVVP
ncbi:MAG: c-type cytochrome biogenesis protein CcmI [Chromatiales bacterium]|jgi:cytochrome c-type biogenesis protein CcmH|nr:c-type cytochrome biogenesis protein CcmI [Chromatiales bacterium]